MKRGSFISCKTFKMKEKVNRKIHFQCKLVSMLKPHVMVEKFKFYLAALLQVSSSIRCLKKKKKKAP